MGELTRREFHLVVAAGAAATMLPACSSGFDGSVTPASGRAVLTFAQFPALASAGGSAIVDVRGQFPLVVVRTDAQHAVALSATCTHQGCILHYDAARADIHCDCHDADFDLGGRVRRGPPPVALPTYAATVDASAITVQLA